MNSPLVSLVVPVFNAEKYLQQCLDSILSQSFSDFELLLINDGSTDRSVQICMQEAERDHRVQVINKENEGVSIARNTGLSAATGEWVCFVDADDVLLDGGLSMLVSGICDKVDMVWGGYKVYDERMDCTYAVSENIIQDLTNEQGIEMLFCPRYYRYLGFVWGRLFRRSVLESCMIRFDEDIHYNEDRLFCTRFLSSSQNRICFMTAPVYGYVEHPKSAMGVLKRSFHPQFVTDLTAMIRMNKCIRQRYPKNGELERLVDYNCFFSWRRMTRMAGFYEQTNAWKRFGIVRSLISGIGLKAFVLLCWDFDMKRIKKRINRLFC